MQRSSSKGPELFVDLAGGPETSDSLILRPCLVPRCLFLVCVCVCVCVCHDFVDFCLLAARVHVGISFLHAAARRFTSMVLVLRVHQLDISNTSTGRGRCDCHTERVSEANKLYLR